ncbi:MAG: hypothetical protein JSS20_05345 [Proteobacteria bacterium]|nr:hypothetical protein [Pseudomonadota bacterium]
MTIDAKAREAFETAFNAMNDWRSDITRMTERHGERVFDKLATAAKAAGWPDTLIDTTKTQLLQASKMQADMIEHMMTVWRDQLQSSASPEKMMNSIRQAMPGQAPDFGNMAMNPAQFWMQATAMWQKNWTDAMSTFMGGGKKS